MIGSRHRARQPDRRGRLRRPRLRRRRPQRLVGARHPGVGVRAARTVPRQVLRHLDLGLGHPARCARRRLDRPARPGPRAAPLPGPGRHPGSRHRGRGRPERRGGQPPAVPDDVLVARADARPPDRQRRLDASRRPVRLGHDQRAGARTSAARSSSCAGAARSRWTAAAPSSRTATRSCCATPPPAPAAAGSRSATWSGGRARPLPAGCERSRWSSRASQRETSLPERFETRWLRDLVNQRQVAAQPPQPTAAPSGDVRRPAHIGAGWPSSQGLSTRLGVTAGPTARRVGCPELV